MVQKGRKEDVCEPGGRRFPVSVLDCRAGPASPAGEREARRSWQASSYPEGPRGGSKGPERPQDPKAKDGGAAARGGATSKCCSFGDCMSAGPIAAPVVDIPVPQAL